MFIRRSWLSVASWHDLLNLQDSLKKPLESVLKSNMVSERGSRGGSEGAPLPNTFERSMLISLSTGGDLGGVGIYSLLEGAEEYYLC